MAVGAERSVSGGMDCELCIVGAGYAGLNGLNAAAKYLARGDRVVVIDKNDRWGGQWLHQYQFLRLHQPYRLFTAGDQPWAIDRPRDHLATKNEVLDHLASVPRVSAGHLEVEPLFGHSYAAHRVVDGRVEVEAHPVADGPPVRVRARRLLKATGLDIEVLRPLTLASDRVRSVGVADPVLATPDFLESDAPVYVIGSGKTAMDLVLHLLRGGGTGRRVHVVTGSGMWFFVRDRGYPTGWRRWVVGALAGDTFLRLVELFDGTNERAVMEQLGREGIAQTVFGAGGNCRYGLLSIGERAEILAGVSDVHRGYLVDVDGTGMTIRELDGTLREVPVEPGAWIVNCTSHFRQLRHEPVLQEGGLVAAPQTTMGFTGTSAYYVVHLWYRDELASVARELRRIRMDVEPKLRFGPEVGVMVMANMAMAGARLPLSVPSRFLGDFNKWYPLHRQLATIARVMANQRMILEKAERLLPLRFADPPDAP